MDKRRVGASGKLIPSKTDWSVRCFPNAFPILSGRAGRHEVIVETAEHGTLWEDLSQKQLALVFEAYQNRFRSLYRPKNAKYVLLFKNFGAKSGASIPHEHAQVVSFPFVPEAVANEVKKAAVLDAWAKNEKAVCENDFFKAICPPVSLYPYEVCILAKDVKNTEAGKRGLNQKKSDVRFEDFSAEQGSALLSLMQTLIRKIKKVQGAPDYTVAFHAAPPRKRMRFHVEIVPRKAVWGGFELGSGVLVDFKSPQDALRELRRA